MGYYRGEASPHIVSLTIWYRGTLLTGRSIMAKAQIVHAINPLKLAKYFVQVCRRGHNHEPHPTKIEGLQLENKSEAKVIYNGGQVWHKYSMGSIQLWLESMLKDAGVIKHSVKDKWSQFVSIQEIETDEDKNIIRIRYSIEKRIDFLDGANPNRSIWMR